MFAAWFYSSERKFSYRTHRHERRNGRKNILFGLISSPNSFPLLVFRETKSRAFRPEMFAFLGLLLTWAGKLFADRRFHLSSSRLSFHEWYHVLRDCLKFCNLYQTIKGLSKLMDLRPKQCDKNSEHKGERFVVKRRPKPWSAPTLYGDCMESNRKLSVRVKNAKAHFTSFEDFAFGWSTKEILPLEREQTSNWIF